LNFPQKGNIPKMNRTPGRNTSSQAITAPTMQTYPWLMVIIVPKYAEKLNSGPGYTCCTPKPA
jgi:hypothetical protein